MTPFCSSRRGGPHVTCIDVDESVQAWTFCGGPEGSEIKSKFQTNEITFQCTFRRIKSIHIELIFSCAEFDKQLIGDRQSPSSRQKETEDETDIQKGRQVSR